MKDLWSWLCVYIIVNGLFFVYVGFGNIDIKILNLNNVTGGFLALFGFVITLLGGILLKINELE